MFEAEVVVKMTGQVFLHAEEPRLSCRRVTGDLVPAGSGDFVKSRLALYFSSAMRDSSLARVAHQPAERLHEDEHDDAVTSRMPVTMPNSVWSGIVLKNPPTHPASLLPNAFDQEPDAHHQADDARRRHLRDGAESDRAQTQLAELGQQVRR